MQADADAQVTVDRAAVADVKRGAQVTVAEAVTVLAAKRSKG